MGRQLTKPNAHCQLSVPSCVFHLARDRRKQQPTNAPAAVAVAAAAAAAAEAARLAVQRRAERSTPAAPPARKNGICVWVYIVCVLCNMHQTSLVGSRWWRWTCQRRPDVCRGFIFGRDSSAVSSMICHTDRGASNAKQTCQYGPHTAESSRSRACGLPSSPLCSEGTPRSCHECAQVSEDENAIMLFEQRTSRVAK